jgi:phosphonate transport system permease protein
VGVQKKELAFGQVEQAPVEVGGILGYLASAFLERDKDAALSTLAWPQVTMILIVILCAVLLSEWVSAKVRHAII